MPTRKISDVPSPREFKPGQQCHHPEHNPPSMIVFDPGVYEHACPACGLKTTFTVGHAIW